MVVCDAAIGERRAPPAGGSDAMGRSGRGQRGCVTETEQLIVRGAGRSAERYREAKEA